MARRALLVTSRRPSVVRKTAITVAAASGAVGDDQRRSLAGHLIYGLLLVLPYIMGRQTLSRVVTTHV